MYFFCSYGIGGIALEGKSHSYGSGNGLSFLMDDVQCTGNEEKITDCQYNTNHNCKLDETAAVTCEPGRGSSNVLQRFFKCAHIISKGYTTLTI